MNQEIIEIALSNYGKRCVYEKLVITGTSEHNGLRYENIIPWSATTDQWVRFETRISGSTIKELEERQIRNFAVQ